MKRSQNHTAFAEKLQKRRDRVIQTGHKLGLTASNAVIIGGAGLALHGLDARYRDSIRHVFDVDAFLSNEKFGDLAAKHWFVNFGNLGYRVVAGRPAVPLPFTGFKSGMLGPNDKNYYPQGYTAAKEDCIEVDGLTTLPAATLAAMKIKAGRPKDVMGIVQAHERGQLAGHPVVQTDGWQQVVAMAVEQLNDLRRRDFCDD